MLQRSKEWFEARTGKFTASDADRLLGKLTLKMTVDKIDNFAKEKASELYFGLSEEEEFLSKDVQRGVELEPYAFKRLKEILALDFIDLEETTFIPIGLNAGASPDGKASNGYNVEIKCPNLTTFKKVVLEDDVNPKHFAQMQQQMLATESKKTYYFNYLIHNNKEYYYLIMVDRCEETIKLLQERIEMATDLRDKHLLVLNEKLNKQD